MKKVQLLLSASAVVFALTAAFSHEALTTAYVSPNQNGTNAILANVQIPEDCDPDNQNSICQVPSGEHMGKYLFGSIQGTTGQDPYRRLNP